MVPSGKQRASVGFDMEQSTDWWSRISAVFAIGSASGYLVGAIIVAEFGRPLALASSDLGLGIREYAVIALLVFVSLGGMGLLALMVMIRANRWYNASNPGLLVGTIIFGSLGIIALLLYVTAISIMLGSPQATNIPLSFGVSGVFFIVAGLGVLGAEDYAFRLLRARGVPPSDPLFRVQRREVVFEYVRSHAALYIAATVAMVLLFTVAASFGVRAYSRQLLAEEDPATPLFLRFLINPQPVCLFGDVDSEIDGRAVTRVATTPNRLVVISEKRVWLVPSERVSLVSTC